MYLIIVFFLGSALGSAGLCFIERKEKSTWLTGRSECPNCHHQLEWFELIPVISYVLQHGKCRECEWTIPEYTLVMEIYGGVISVIVWLIPVHSIIINALILILAIYIYKILAEYMIKQQEEKKDNRKDGNNR